MDEAGRGPLAGPVAVGVAAVPLDFDWALLPGVGDSKNLSPKKREAVFSLAETLIREGVIKVAVYQSTNKVIDKRGIKYAIDNAMEKALSEIKVSPLECEVRLDGALRAPSIYEHQTTIIGGDGKEQIIGLASIFAKVTRDRYMTRMAAKPPFASYQFEIHKGYGTKMHRELIQKHGLSDIHRHTFCRNVLA